MVVKIQAGARGFLARNDFYMNMKNTFYMPENDDMRKRFIGFKLGLISKKQNERMRKEREEAGLLDSMVDKNIKDTDQLLESFYPNVQRIMNEKNERAQESFKKKQKAMELDQFWTEVKAKAMARNECECPICYMPFVFHKQTVLLDCSHLYHQNCLDNYEKFDREANYDLPSKGQHACPMCRHPNYKKILINL